MHCSTLRYYSEGVTAILQLVTRYNAMNVELSLFVNRDGSIPMAYVKITLV